ncbi:hypothetical protein L9F63_014337 [Diploptera punctata]|uniref:Peptidase S1 domain-containing protein n=1 Tax=Diploptera punctata TaxID=6984 RepID=A0AAD8ELP8_DIPPU|nr:hypothetical protein L9F63_014337 [Diploptera punctata]
MSAVCRLTAYIKRLLPLIIHIDNIAVKTSGPEKQWQDYSYENTTPLYSTLRRIDSQGLQLKNARIEGKVIGGKVIGGKKAERGMFPYVVIVTFNFETTYVLGWTMCTGSIVTERWILTAAHCVPNETMTEKKYKVGQVDDEFGDYQNIKSITKHPDFREVSYNGNLLAIHNDICLLYTEDKIQFNKYVGKVCISSTRKMSGECLIAGFGDTNASSGMHYAFLKYKEIEKKGEISNTITIDLDGPYPYPGDSGGPLMCDGKQGHALRRDDCSSNDGNIDDSIFEFFFKEKCQD